jgi:hypothetical protein
MKVFTAIHQDCRLLPHFLRHYTALGVTSFNFCVHPSLEKDVRAYLGSHPAIVRPTTDVASALLGDASAVSAMRAQFQGVEEWVLIVDLDEFLASSCELEKIISAADRAGTNVVRAIMHDRFTITGLEYPIREEEDLGQCFPIKSRFIRDVMGGCDMKGVLVKGLLQPVHQATHHRFEGEVVYSQALDLSHYKWITGALDRLRNTHQLVLEAGIGWASEFERVMEHYALHGCFAWWLFSAAPVDDYVAEPPDHCSVCEAVIDHQENLYSRNTYGQPLCRRHQQPQGTVR